MSARLRPVADLRHVPLAVARRLVGRARATSRATRIWLAVAALGTAVDLFLRSRVPFTVGLPSGQDAVLFMRQATALKGGHWLGPFDSLLLSKGPAYPAFMAVAWTLHLGLGMADQLAWLLAALAVAGCVRTATGGLALPVATYLFVAFDPAMFDSAHSEVYRDSLYQSLSLLAVALLFLALRAAIVGERRARRVVLAVIAGVSFAAFWLCREEGPWLVPAVAVLAVGLAGGALWRRLAVRAEHPVTRRHVRNWAIRGVAVGAVVAVSFVLPIASVMVENHRMYGVAMTNDMTQGAFPRAFAAWTRVEAGPAVVHVPISRSMREAVYAVSPSAAQLSSVIESPDNPWYGISCGHRARPKCDVTGAFTPWLLRDAAAAIGYFQNERDFQNFFGDVARQITAACDDGRLRCRVAVPVSLQPFVPATAKSVKVQLRATWHEVLWSQRFYDLPRGVRPLSPRIQDAAAGIIRGYPSTQQARETLASFEAHTTPYDILIRVYRFLVPLLALVATVTFLVELVWWRRRASALAVLGIAFAAGIAARLVLFAYVGATQYGVVSNVRYHLPTHALLLAYGAVGGALAARRLAPLVVLIRNRDRRPSPAPDVDEMAGAAS